MFHKQKEFCDWEEYKGHGRRGRSGNCLHRGGWLNKIWGSSILTCTEDMSCKPHKIMKNISYFNYDCFLSIFGFYLGVATLPNFTYPFTLENTWDISDPIPSFYRQAEAQRCEVKCSSLLSK